MTNAPKKLIVTAEAMARIMTWLGEDREVHMFLCPDLGCLAAYFSIDPEVRCVKHAWAAVCHMERRSILADDLELEPPPQPTAPDAPRTWKIITYDVWGNEEDGYEVNQAFYSGAEIELPPEPSDEHVRSALVQAGYLRKGIQLRTLDFDGDDGLIQIKRKRDGRPLLEIQVQE